VFGFVLNRRLKFRANREHEELVEDST